MQYARILTLGIVIGLFLVLIAQEAPAISVERQFWSSPDYAAKRQRIQARRSQLGPSKSYSRPRHANTLRSQVANLPAPLRQRLAQIESKFGQVGLVSICRPGATFRSHGRSFQSEHANCAAIDFIPPKGKRVQVLAWLKANHRGYVLQYSWSPHLHIDSGRYKYAAKPKTWPIATVARKRPLLEALIPTEAMPIAYEPQRKPLEAITAIDRRDIFARYEETLFQVAGRCREFANLDWRVKQIVADSVRHFKQGPALLSSCYRDQVHNRRVGGAKYSFHLQRKAIDYKIAGVDKWKLFEWVKKHRLAGGVGIYKSAAIHIDVRPRRAGLVTTWNWNAKTKWVAAKKWSKKKYAALKKRLKRKGRTA